MIDIFDNDRQCWTILDNIYNFGQFWTILDNFGQFWTMLDNFDNFGQFSQS